MLDMCCFGFFILVDGGVVQSVRLVTWSDRAVWGTTNKCFVVWWLVGIRGVEDKLGGLDARCALHFADACTTPLATMSCAVPGVLQMRHLT